MLKNIKELHLINEDSILKCEELLWKTYHSLKPMVAKSEHEDLKQDILLTLIEADRDFDPAYEVRFSTFLYPRLNKLGNDILTRYTGIKLWRSEKDRIESSTGEKIYINIIEFEEKE